MTIATIAAVMRGQRQPLSVESVRVDDPGPGEVLVRMVAVGVCGSDEHVLNGHYPAPIPSVCGHEGAGVVEAVGPGVVGIAAGDHVLQLFVGPCGHCAACRRGRRSLCTGSAMPDGRFADGRTRLTDAQGEPIASTLGLASFAGRTVCPARNLVVIPSDIDLDVACLVSCGVSTGVGAVLNMARLRPGDHVAVVGLGGVGAAAVLGAVLGGAARIVAIDIDPAKEAVARELGATDFVDATATDPADAVRSITAGWGADRIILAADVVRPEQHTLAGAMVAPGGVIVQVGATAPGTTAVAIAPGVLVTRHASVTGTVYGGDDPAADALRYIELARAGRLDLERLITRRYPFARINDAFSDLRARRNVRGVLLYD